ncbi:RagB/SusD family nutrient uptake outer membrane protein [Flavobacterium sp. ANB]|uniref:RagB/SusD family nutrient uptake outer membrane protein n=1 Tax=unclassified Flavobacterium TaxID=196869 RepID=UPI0012B916D1|nr:MULTISPECIES: RagB/SusD family nutrient uptake outer membrane protein [unclassified Flavobacterium]MBF4516468.1 RagB/SusD family nutrient uptake outer membrane protein [Flavobacterium sp. ANB]MTD69634.1 RagB/SusD family nutrient uptake outer membrane protein [Flavobacterium sp. LC2016-13]
MKKYLFTFLITITLILTVTTSCSDEFVDPKPVYSIDSENYFNSKSDYDEALIAAYDLLQATYVNVLLGEIASDNTLCGGESPTDVIGFQQIDDMTHTQVNSNLRDIWNWMFAGVQRANYILEFQNKTDFSGKTQLIAETRFLRAYYQFELVKWFGGIPMKADARFKIGDEKTVPRSSVAEVYASIEADLIFAAANLSPNAAQKGRATKGAAQALLGKAYLYQGKFLEAATTLQALITTTPYTLETDYNKIFEAEGENGSESVFEVQYTDVEGAGFTCLQCSEGNVAVGFSGVRNYTGPLFSSGFSFNIPTQESANAFEVGDRRKNVAILDIVAFAAANSGVSYGKGNEDTGFFNRKYLPRKRSAEAAGDLNLTNPNNYRAIRYADVLLMAAEAYNRGGIDDGKAREYLNQVRRRAFGDNNHDISVSGAALTDFIATERRLELFGEGHRFFDLVRTGKAAGTIPGFTANKNELFPLPIEEIQFANGNWKQNPGY